MTKNFFIVSVASILILLLSFGCASQKKITDSNQFIDIATPTDAIPLVIGDSVSATELKASWSLDFSDEFNDTVIDPKKWTVETSVKSRIDIALYADEQQVEERDGNAFIYYRKSPLHDTAYNAGRFNSKGKYAPIYGYFECKMHVVKPNGHQTAFWMMPEGNGMKAPDGVDGTANDGAEIDIVEGNRIKSYSLGLHWDAYAKPAHKSNGRQIKLPTLHDTEYHIYGFQWDPQFLKFYFDGKVVATIKDPKLIPKVAEYIYLTGSCFGKNDWVDGDIRKNDFIQQGNTDMAYIDYVRVYKMVKK